MSDDPSRHAALTDLAGLLGRESLVIDGDGLVIFVGEAAEERLGTNPLGRHLDEVARVLDLDEDPPQPHTRRRRIKTPGPRPVSVDADERTGDLADQPVRVLTLDAVVRQASRPCFDTKDTTDPLTGLPNRNRFLDELSTDLDRGRDVAILLVDIDRFHRVNDRLGHDRADALLARLAQRIADAAGDMNLLARLTGDEFVVLCRQPTDIADPRDLVGRIGRAVTAPDPDVDDLMTVSIGIALSATLTETASDGRGVASLLLSNADAALYRSKKQGRGRYELFDPDLERSRSGRYEVEVSLRGALERGELELAFQPQVSVATGAVKGAEALLRWRRSGIVVPPDQFISIAEQTGLIVPIGEWVAAEAARTLADWDTRWPGTELVMSINVSVRQLDEADIVEQLVGAVQAAGIDPSRFKLEITESVLLGDADHALAVLCALRDAGFSLAMDDFGTGYSSLTYLKKLPVDTVKIDKSFVATVNDSNDDSTIVSMIVALSHALGLDIVAEGVESFEQAATLYALRCQYGQGFYWSRPLSPSAAIDWLERSLAVDAAAG